MGYFRAPAAGGAPQPCDDQRVEAKPLLVNDHLDAAAVEFGQAWYRVIERIDQHLVATAQQFPRQDNELALGATHGEATDNLEDPHSHLGDPLSCSSSAHATFGKRAAATASAPPGDRLP